MSNTCPKCGAESSYNFETFTAYNCGTDVAHGKEHITRQSDHCRGRAEAIAELDAWHTVSDVEPSIGNGQCIVVKTQNNHGKWYSILRRVSHCWETDYGEPLSWRDVLLAVNSETTKQWREVRP